MNQTLCILLSLICVKTPLYISPFNGQGVCIFFSFPTDYGSGRLISHSMMLRDKELTLKTPYALLAFYEENI
jgi:hypothetical protein